MAGLSAAAWVAAATGALAENAKVRLAYLVADSMLPMMYAQEKGYFKDAGIDLEATAVQGGPAVVAALASGEADIGYSAFIPPINGHIAGVPIKLMLTLAHESQPDHLYTFIVASKASGIADMKGLAGKKVVINANGGLCELMLRDHLSANGMKFEDVQLVVLPFPETEKALEQGSVDATCSVNPFYASITTNANVGAKVVASGMLADLSTPVVQDGVYGLEDWLAKNGDASAKFAQVMDKARKELLADRGLLEAASVKHMELTPEAAKSFTLPILKPEMNISAEDVQRVLDAMIRNGMNPGPLNGADFVAPVTY
ncbi:MAG: ABC transporter substrate-binding protein [Phyllobacteriaceae bacterium]|nr:ABC transporter substrate-binding protein [Phyllobacteriaceae bacterium]